MNQILQCLIDHGYLYSIETIGIAMLHMLGHCNLHEVVSRVWRRRTEKGVRMALGPIKTATAARSRPSEASLELDEFRQ